MIIVSDAAPVISLAKIDQVDLLGRLFDEVLLPQAVFDEVCRNAMFADEADAIRNCSFMSVRTVSHLESVRNLLSLGLDSGESEAIVLADSLETPLLLIDERKGRQVAQKLGIPVVGTLGILLQAKRDGMIGRLKPLLDTLLEHNIRIGGVLYRDILEQAGEG